MTQRAVLLVLLLLAALPAAAAEPPQAEQVAQLSLAPARVFVHQQVVLQILIAHPVRFEPRWEAPPFDGLWPEPLPTDGTPMYYRAAVAERTTRFRRALFPTRAGEIEIRPSRIWLRDAQGNERAVPVAGARLQVDRLPPPAAGEPPAALVGEVSVRVVAAAEPVIAGHGLPLRIDVLGDANVWDLEPPDVEAWFGPQAEVFAGRVQIATDDHDGRLSTRRSFVFELVPAREGTLEIPAYEVRYFDPRSRSYRRARADPQRVTVQAAPPQSAPAVRIDDAAAVDHAERTSRPWLRLGIAVSVSTALMAAFALRSRGREAIRSEAAREVAARHSAPPDARQLLADAQRESRSGPLAAALARAVRAALSQRHGVDAAALTSVDVARDLRDAEAASLLAALDRVRFRGEAVDRGALVAAVQAYLARHG